MNSPKQQDSSPTEALKNRATHLRSLLKIVDPKASAQGGQGPQQLFVKAVNAEIDYIESKLKKS